MANLNLLVEGYSSDIAHIGTRGAPWVIACCCLMRQPWALVDPAA